MVLLMASPKSTTIIQKDFWAKTHFAEARLGGWPGKFPHRLSLANKRPMQMAAHPITVGTTRQENHSMSISAIRGAATKPRFGAISWIETAFPQWLESTISVSVVMPEGRYSPAAMPRKNMAARRAHRSRLAAITRSATPTTVVETTIEYLWVIRADRNPEPSRAMK